MAIRYCIDLPCVPREAMGREDLARMVARWERAQAIRADFVSRYGARDEEEMRFRERRVAVGGEQLQETSVAEIRRQCQPLEDLAHHCVGCPAALMGEPFSCHGAISLPIPAEAEAWLIDQVAPDGTRCASLFLDATDQHPIGPSPFQGWRRAGFLAAAEPATAVRNGRTITSDQLLMELFAVGDIRPDHALGPLLYLQLLATEDGRRGDDVLAIVEGVSAASAGDIESAPAIGFRLRPEPALGESIGELTHFFLAIFIAFSLETPLTLDL